MPTRGTHLAAAMLLGVLTALWSPEWIGAQATGTIRGRVQIGVPISTRRPSSAYGTRTVTQPALAPVSEVKHVVVFLGKVPPRSTPPRQAEIRQLKENFVPRVVAVPVGSQVEFPNDDPIYHNVFSLSRAKTFNLGRYPKNETRRVRFDKPGTVRVFCEIHSHMTATVMVFDHPWFDVPEEGGGFELSDVPPGEYQITAWHERLGDTTATVRVDAGRPATIEFVLPVPPQ